ncbi:MAG TPA: YraN family protein [Candidatus Fimivivens sp.]|nr:YraN family protein [Candidatus Fimivivens sp.]
MGLIRRFHLTNPTGSRGEDIAATFLRSLGYRILDRNYRNDRGRALGEIDIVAKEGKELVFVEVKTRTIPIGSVRTVIPEESITQGKLRRLSRIAEGYVKEKRIDSVPYRFDAVSILIREGADRPEIRHLKGIFL